MKSMLSVSGPKRSEVPTPGGENEPLQAGSPGKVMAITAAALLSGAFSGYAMAGSPELLKDLSFDQSIEIYSSAHSPGLEATQVKQGLFVDQSRKLDEHAKFIQQSFLPTYGDFCEQDIKLEKDARAQNRSYLGCSVIGVSSDNKMVGLVSLTTDRDSSNSKIVVEQKSMSLTDRLAFNLTGKAPDYQYQDVHVPKGFVQKLQRDYSQSDALEISTFVLTNASKQGLTSKSEFVDRVLKTDPIAGRWISQDSQVESKLMLAQELGAFPKLTEPLKGEDIAAAVQAAKADQWLMHKNKYKEIDRTNYEDTLRLVLQSPLYKHIEPLLDYRCAGPQDAPSFNSDITSRTRACMVESGLTPSSDLVAVTDQVSAIHNGVVVGIHKGTPVVLTRSDLPQFGGAFAIDSALQPNLSKGALSESVEKHFDRMNHNGTSPVHISINLLKNVPDNLRSEENDKLYARFVFHHEFAHVLQFRHHALADKEHTPLITTDAEVLTNMEGTADVYAIKMMQNIGQYSENEMRTLKNILSHTHGNIKDESELTALGISATDIYATNQHREDRKQIRDSAWAFEEQKDITSSNNSRPTIKVPGL